MCVLVFYHANLVEYDIIVWNSIFREVYGDER